MNGHAVGSRRPQPSVATGGFGFAIVLAYLVAEYGRPQDRISLIGALHPNWILIFLMLIAWAMAKYFRRVACAQLWTMVAMLALCAIHVPLAANNFRAFQTTEGFLLLLPFCISIILFVDTASRLRTFLKWWSALALYISANALFGLGIAGSGFLDDENDVALLLVLMLPIVYYVHRSEPKRTARLIYLVICVLCVAGIISTRSRGGFVGLLVVVSIIWAFSARKLLSLIVILLLASGVYLSTDQKYWDRMGTIENTDQGTAKGRLDSWQAGWDMFKDHPLGVGPGNFPIHFAKYQPMSMPHSMWGRAAHSLWFTLLPELGIPGAILYLLLLRANVRDLRTLRRREREATPRRSEFGLSMAYLASIAGFFASGTFLSVFYYPHYWYLSAMIVATTRIAAPGDAIAASAAPAPRPRGGAVLGR